MLDKIVQGASWSILAGLVNKVCTFLGQIALAWLLSPDDFGIAAIALGFMQIGSIFNSGGVKTHLIQTFPLDNITLTNAFWLNITICIIIILPLASLSEFLSAAYGMPELRSALLLSCVIILISGISSAPFGKLQSDLKFRSVSLINLLEGFVQTVAAIGLGALGVGAASLVGSRIVSAAAALLLSLRASKFRPLSGAQFEIVGTLALKSLPLASFSFLTIALLQLPILLLGVYFDPDEVGIFYWSTQLAGQAIFLLTINLREVLIPGFVHTINAGNPIDTILIKGLGIMVVVISLLSIAQVAFAEFVIVNLFDPIWWDAIPVVRFISLGLLYTPITTMTVALLLAQRKSTMLICLTLIHIGSVMLSTYVFSQTGELMRAVEGYVYGLTVNGLFSCAILIRHARLHLDARLCSVLGLPFAVFSIGKVLIT